MMNKGEFVCKSNAHLAFILGLAKPDELKAERQHPRLPWLEKHPESFVTSTNPVYRKNHRGI